MELGHRFVAADVALHDLKIRPFVVWRQRGVHLRRALDLGDLRQRLVAHPELGIGLVHRRAVALGGLEHQPVAAVGIVRDGQHVGTLGAPGVHGLPEVLRVVRHHRGVGQLRDLGGAEDHVAVQVPAIRGGGVLVRHEGGEPARVVVPRRGLLDFSPGAPGDGGVAELLGHAAALEAGDHPAEGGGDLLGVGAEQALDERQLVQRTVGIVRLAHGADVFGVVGDRGEVQRTARQADVEPGGVADRIALGEPVSVVRHGAHVEDVGVERQPGMDVQVAEIGVAVGVVAGEVGGRLRRGRGPGRRRLRGGLGAGFLRLSGRRACCAEGGHESGRGEEPSRRAAPFPIHLVSPSLAGRRAARIVLAGPGAARRSVTMDDCPVGRSLSKTDVR